MWVTQNVGSVWDFCSRITFAEKGDWLVEDAAEEIWSTKDAKGAKTDCGGWGCWDMGLGNSGRMNSVFKEGNTLLLNDNFSHL